MRRYWLNSSFSAEEKQPGHVLSYGSSHIVHYHVADAYYPVDSLCFRSSPQVVLPSGGFLLLMLLSTNKSIVNKPEREEKPWQELLILHPEILLEKDTYAIICENL